ncbi:MAG: DUF4142 domain-containing protein, partial [Bacteroidia bacterium]|nr:DUF4142 domain-containing protein [Bacteroidia bacterium]
MRITASLVENNSHVFAEITLKDFNSVWYNFDRVIQRSKPTKIMKVIHILKTFVLATVILTSCQPNQKEENSSEIAKEHNDTVFNDKDDEKDADFIVNAVAANLSEINLAQLALTKSTDSEVKKIAGMLEADHTKVLNNLTGYAATNGISTPTTETPEATKDR